MAKSNIAWISPLSAGRTSFLPKTGTQSLNGASRRPINWQTCRSMNRSVKMVMSSSSSQDEKKKEHDHTPMTNLVNEEWDGSQMNADTLIKQVKWNSDGLVAAIAQQEDSNEVLMMAWMNEESIRETLRQGRVVYYSRSRKTLWRKGDTSGQVQFLKDIILDCDGDTLLLKVNQIGVACHTGRRSCFYTAYRPPYGEPKIIADVLMDPKQMYGVKK